MLSLALSDWRLASVPKLGSSPEGPAAARMADVRCPACMSCVCASVSPAIVSLEAFWFAMIALLRATWAC
jgi:hypothetical protein